MLVFYKQKGVRGMEFKNNINEILERKNIKQADLCRMTNISTALMSKYSTGKVSPTLENAIKIADALNITLDELAGRKSEKFLTIAEEELLENFRSLDTDGQDKISEYASLLSAKKFLQSASSSATG